MGYVSTGNHKKGTKLEVDVRGKRRGAEVVGMPFVPTKYWKGVPPPA
jgi:aminomethyltransferase